MNFFQIFKDIFPEIIGNTAVKLALTLNLIEPRCSGVLILGKKGTGKSFLLKCLKKFLKVAKWPYLEIPLGTTEDSLLGGVHIEKTLERGTKIYEKGLLEKAKERFVLIDDINLFPEEYLSLIFEKSETFNLVATLNPEEGVISSHFLDRFGMCVITENLINLKQRLNFLKFCENYYNFEELYLENYQNFLKYLEISKVLRNKIKFEEALLDKICEIVSKEFISSHRAEIFLFYTSLAYASLRGDLILAEKHVEEIAPFVLIHRKKELEEKSNTEKDNQNKETSTQSKDRNKREDTSSGSTSSSHFQEFSEKQSQDFFDFQINFSSAIKEEIFNIGEIFKFKRLSFKKDRILRSLIGRRTKSKTKLKGGRFLKSVFFNQSKELDFFGTIKAAAPFQIFRKREDKLIIYKDDFRYKEKERKIGHLIVFLVDASSSMGVQKRMEAVKGAIVSLLMDSYQKRDKISLITFRREQAEVVLTPTSSVELAYKKLKELPTGGKTPLSLGLLEAYKLIKRFHLKYPEMRSILICLSDGKANVALKPEKNPLKEAFQICTEIRKLEYVDTVVVDCEIKNNFLRMEFSKELAERLGGKYFILEELKADNLTSLVIQAKCLK